MGIDFINRVAKTSFILSLIQFPFTAVYWSFQNASGIFIGCLWGAANILLIKYIITGLLTPKPSSSKRKMLILGFIKFPLLYGIGFLLLEIGYFSAISLLIGFTIIFLVALLKALGIYLIDNKIINTELPNRYNRSSIK